MDHRGGLALFSVAVKYLPYLPKEQRAVNRPVDRDRALGLARRY